MEFLESVSLFTLTFSVGLFSYSYYRFMAYKVRSQNRLEMKMDKYIQNTQKILEKITDNQKEELLSNSVLDELSTERHKLTITPKTDNQKEELLSNSVLDELSTERHKLTITPKKYSNINSNKLELKIPKSKSFDFNITHISPDMSYIPYSVENKKVNL